MVVFENSATLHGNLTCHNTCTYLVHTRTYWDVPFSALSTSMYWVHTGTYWYIPVCTKYPDFVQPVGIPQDGVLMPLGQKHTSCIWTGNLTLIKRTALSTEPQLLILDGIFETLWFMKLDNKNKNCKAENMLECVVAACQLLCWVQQWRYDLGTLMKSEYHHDSVLLQPAWILLISTSQESENINTLWQLLAYNQRDSNIRMV